METKTEPNIIFVGKRNEITKDNRIGPLVPIPVDEIPLLRINGNKKLQFPSGEVQRKGFYHPEAAFILQAYPTQFKRFVKKGKQES